MTSDKRIRTNNEFLKKISFETTKKNKTLAEFTE